MPTTYTKTIGGTSPDYATIALAHADVSTIVGSSDLVASDAEVIFLLRGVTHLNATLDEGLTTDETRKVTYRPDTGAEHLGVWGDGPKIEPSTSGHGLSIGDNHTVIEGLEIWAGTATSDECIRILSGTIGVKITGCLLTGENCSSSGDGVYIGNWAGGSSTYPIVVENCSIVDCSRGGIHGQYFTAGTGLHVFDIVNCSIAQCQYGIGYDRRSGSGYSFYRIVNTVTWNNSNDFSFTNGAASGTADTTGSTNNLGEDDSDTIPARIVDVTITTNTSPGAGNWVIIEDDSVTVTGGHDARLVDDADNYALDAGVGPSSNALVPTVDAAGYIRSGTTTDIGFYNVSTYTVPPIDPVVRRIFICV